MTAAAPPGCGNPAAAVGRARVCQPAARAAARRRRRAAAEAARLQAEQHARAAVRAEQCGRLGYRCGPAAVVRMRGRAVRAQALARQRGPPRWWRPWRGRARAARAPAAECAARARARRRASPPRRCCRPRARLQPHAAATDSAECVPRKAEAQQGTQLESSRTQHARLHGCGHGAAGLRAQGGLICRARRRAAGRPRRVWRLCVVRRMRAEQQRGRRRTARDQQAERR